jgi:hypothetical protein
MQCIIYRQRINEDTYKINQTAASSNLMIDAVSRDHDYENVNHEYQELVELNSQSSQYDSYGLGDNETNHEYQELGKLSPPFVR